MRKELLEFERIMNLLIPEEGVVLGKMMSSPGIQYNGKVFAFLYKEKMCFKLGASNTLENLGVLYEFLNPFKIKSPLKDWFVVRSGVCR